MAAKELEKTKHRSFPACSDIFEEKGNIILKMEMPGVTRENLEIKIENDILVIHGKRDLHRDGKANFLIREIKDGDFFHEYTIDHTIDREKIDASLQKGVLTLTLSLKESEKPRKIEVVST